MVYKTFNEWKAEGRPVRKGEKSHRRNENGVPLFSDAQVKIKKRGGYAYHLFVYEDENFDDFYMPGLNGDWW